MKIFYLFPRSGNAVGLPQADTWRRNILPTLHRLGHEVDEYYEPVLEQLSSDDGLDRAWVEKNQGPFVERVLEDLRSSHRRRPIDLFLSYVWDPMFTGEGLKEVRLLSIPTVNFFCNYFNGFERIASLAPLFDFNWVSDRSATALYQRIGARAVFLPMAANPEIYRPYPFPRQYPVTFVGGRYGNRPDYISDLLEHKLPVRVWGPGWQGKPAPKQPALHRWRRFLQRVPHRMASSGGLLFLRRRLQEELQARFSKERSRRETELARIAGPPLGDEELIQMYSRSQISLGFSVVGSSHLESSPVTQIRLRDFEAPMSGAFYLTEYSEGIEELYELDREIVVFRSKEELADKVRFYLAHEDAAEKIRVAGRRRALSEHTWQTRFDKLFASVRLEIGQQHDAVRP